MSKLITQYAVYVNGQIVSHYRSYRAAAAEADRLMRLNPNWRVTVEDDTYYE